MIANSNRSNSARGSAVVLAWLFASAGAGLVFGIEWAGYGLLSLGALFGAVAILWNRIR